MAKLDICFPHLLKWEGGYANDPDDPGGQTNYGITDGLDGIEDGKIDIDGDRIPDVDVKDLTPEQAKVIYKREFWDKMRGDEIQSQAIAGIMFDGFVNCGKWGIKLLQRIISVPDDGVFGPQSVRVLNEQTKVSTREILIYTLYKEARLKYYEDLVVKRPRSAKFLKGWKRRVNSFPTL
jgi:lysozyme family protein